MWYNDSLIPEIISGGTSFDNASIGTRKVILTDLGGLSVRTALGGLCSYLQNPFRLESWLGLACVRLEDSMSPLFSEAVNQALVAEIAPLDPGL